MDPGDYGIQRQLRAAGHECVVVAPSLIPRKPGDRIKTNRRVAINLTKLHRAGELTSVWVPDPAHEAIRYLVRAKSDILIPRCLLTASARLAVRNRFQDGESCSLLVAMSWTWGRDIDLVF